MISNSTKMTFEDKIVQRIKETSVYELVQDEDTLRGLTERAIKEALFGTEKKYYGNQDKGPIVAAAEAVARQLAKDAVERVLNDPEVMKRLHHHLAIALPGIITSSIENGFETKMRDQVSQSTDDLRTAIRGLEIR